jgi:hypothetical protein
MFAASRLPLVSTKRLIEYLPTGMEFVSRADNSSPSRTKVKNAWNFSSTPHTSSWRVA